MHISVMLSESRVWIDPWGPQRLYREYTDWGDECDGQNIAPFVVVIAVVNQSIGRAALQLGCRWEMRTTILLQIERT